MYIPSRLMDWIRNLPRRASLTREELAVPCELSVAPGPNTGVWNPTKKYLIALARGSCCARSVGCYVWSSYTEAKKLLLTKLSLPIEVGRNARLPFGICMAQAVAWFIMSTVAYLKAPGAAPGA